MPARNKTCPKCQAVMEAGYLSDPAGRIPPHLWRPGPAKFGLRALFASTTNRFNITAYRCASCGFVESWTDVP